MFDDFFAKAHELTQRGEPFATAVVVRAEAPTSGKPGDRAIITRDGVLHGWIGGSCAQPTVVKEALAALREDAGRLIRLSPDPAAQAPREGLRDVPMTCFSGGTLEVYIEPHHPRPRLLIAGNLPVAQALAHLGKAMNYHVIAVEQPGSPPIAGADETTSLDDLAKHVSPFTYVVIATHGQFDETAIVAALRARAPYVGLVASPKRAESVRDFLAGAGLSSGDMLALKAPAGLDIQARRGDEIALSIMAEIVQRRRSAEQMSADLFAPAVAPPETAKIAIDPICKMEVEIATAIHMSDHAGVRYYFCCPHCKARFDKNPQKYLAQAG